MQRFLQRALKASKKFSKEVNKKPQILILLGLFIFLVGASKYYSLRILSFNVNEVEGRGEVNAEKFPVKISIPSIEIDLAVEPANIKNGVWDISYQNATFLASSSVPGEKGNIIIYGHNKKAIFGNLPYLSIGQKVILEDEQGKKYTYEVYKKDFVRPDRIDLVSPTNYEELTLFTCFGLLDSQRAVLKAKPVD